MRNDRKAELVIDAPGMAVTRGRPRPGVIHHSDRGSQYTTLAFGKTLIEGGVLPSMGRRGDAFDDALAESFFATLETELSERRCSRPGTSSAGSLRLHRGLLQPEATPLRPRPPLPGRA